MAGDAKATVCGAPGFWMHETSGVLRPAVLAYLGGGPLTERDLLHLRAYLRQWAAAPVWAGPEANRLARDAVDLKNRADVDAWLDRAVAAGMDPL